MWLLFRDPIPGAVERALGFTIAQQAPDGAFPAYQLELSWEEGAGQPVPTILHTAWIVTGFRHWANMPAVEASAERGRAYLRGRRWKGGLYGTLVEDGPDALFETVPTTAAWVAMGVGRGENRVAEKRFRKALESIRREDGTYAPYFGVAASAASAWHPAVIQSAVLVFQAAAGAADAGLCARLASNEDVRKVAEMAARGDLLRNLALLWELAPGCIRSAETALRSQSEKVLMDEKASSYDTSAALLLLATFCGENLESGVAEGAARRLMSRQQPDGGWPLEVQIWSPARAVRYESRALTTMLAAESLEQWRRCRVNRHTSSVSTAN